MILRKINSVLSILTAFMLIDHAIFHAVWMLTKGGVEKDAETMPWVLVGMMMIHAVISIALAIRGHRGAEKRKCNSYPKMNIQTYVQRATGMLLPIFTALHVLGTVGVLQPPQAVHAILPPLFFTVALAHVAVSGSRAFLSLGIGNAKFIKVADIAVKVLCALILIADIVGFYTYLV